MKSEFNCLSWWVVEGADKTKVKLKLKLKLKLRLEWSLSIFCLKKDIVSLKINCTEADLALK